jgi:tetratricopeptide (TPR) repeat protein
MARISAFIVCSVRGNHPSGLAVSNSNSIANSFVECADKILALLKSRSDIPPNLEPEVEEVIKRAFPLPPSSATASISATLDTRGSQLWNATTNLVRNAEEAQHGPASKGDGRSRFTAALRVFAYFLLDAAHSSLSRRKKDHDQRMRVFKVALKAARFCLDSGQDDFALRVLERSSDFVTHAEDETPIVELASNDASDAADCQLFTQQMVTEFYLLRMTHAWKAGRFDVADHFLSKINARSLTSSAALAEKAADLFHEAGKALANRNATEPAIQWYQRALDALDNCGVEYLSQDAPELRLAITGSMVEALIAVQAQDLRERASPLLDQLESAYGMSKRIAVSMLRFRISTAHEDVDAGELYSILRQMIRLAIMTDQSFRRSVLTYSDMYCG